MADEPVFHIRNARPSDLAATLVTLEEYPNLSTINDIVSHADSLGLSIRDRQRLDALVVARELGLVDEGSNILTRSGKALAGLHWDKPDLFVDVVHGLQYTLWSKDHPELFCFSWSYRTVCQILWESGSKDLPGRRDLASEVESKARLAFERADIAFSRRSIGGAVYWLSEVKPPVLDEEETRFSRRAFCPPELFVMAVNFVYRTREIDYGVNLLLGDENRYAICQACLLDPECFDRVLEYAVAQFDYLHKGIGGGWGQYLSLDRACNLEEFI